MTKGKFLSLNKIRENYFFKNKLLEDFGALAYQNQGYLAVLNNEKEFILFFLAYNDLYYKRRLGGFLAVT